VTVGSFVHRAVSKREMHRWVKWVDESHDADLAHDETETKTKTKTRRRQDQKKKRVVRSGDRVRVFENRRDYAFV
jgi:hypothetical protein